jgi:DNA-binding winged helix-turn-helix (wHTH) protein
MLYNTYSTPISGESPFVFGPFEFDPTQRVLLRAGEPLRIGSRAREILLALLENAGTIVKKRALIARVWSNTIVSEGTMRVHIAQLRKLLGDGQDGPRYIENVSGIGYRFLALVTRPGVHPIDSGLVELLAQVLEAKLTDGIPENVLRTAHQLRKLLERSPVHAALSQS